jgi:hypothetical protein
LIVLDTQFPVKPVFGRKGSRKACDLIRSWIRRRDLGNYRFSLLRSLECCIEYGRN